MDLLSPPSLHDTVLKRYRVAAGSARPLRDYHLMHDSSFIHDYRLPRDPSYSTILPSFTTTSALAIPPWKSLPESPPAPRTVSHHVPTSRPSPRRPPDTQGPAVGSFEPQSDFVPIGEVAAASGGGGPTIFPIGHEDGTDTI